MTTQRYRGEVLQYRVSSWKNDNYITVGDEDSVLQEFVAIVVDHMAERLAEGDLSHDDFFHEVDVLKRIDRDRLYKMKNGDTQVYKTLDGEFKIECLVHGGE